jgi:hypothetical protein
MAEVRCLRLNISRKSLLVLGLAECRRLRIAITMRRMRRELAFSEFIANGECKGPGEKSGPFRGHPFSKRLSGRNQRILV